MVGVLEGGIGDQGLRLFKVGSAATTVNTIASSPTDTPRKVVVRVTVEGMRDNCPVMSGASHWGRIKMTVVIRGGEISSR